MTYTILLRPSKASGVRATALELPGCEVEAPTREAALAQIQQAVAEVLEDGEIVKIEVPEPDRKALRYGLPMMGAFRDDPTWDEFLGEVERFRTSHNHITDE